MRLIVGRFDHEDLHQLQKQFLWEVVAQSKEIGDSVKAAICQKLHRSPG